jgi:sugar phosphate isomerase/epimerase
MSRPVLRHVANVWTLRQHPTRGNEWSLEQKLRAIKEAGFDGVCWAGSPELHEGTMRHGLIFICPEMGPVAGGYNLSTLPNSWEDAKVLRVEIDKLWKTLTS